MRAVEAKQTLESLKKGWTESDIDLQLVRIRRIVDLMSLRPSIPVITVAGTNGKGSTVKLLSSIYQAAGFRVGSFYSPHIHSLNERIQIQNQHLSDEAFSEAYAAVQKVSDQSEIKLTFFELLTSMALYTFKHADLDIIILEVGLGGNFDAVNVIDPTVSVITTIGLDHAKWLGETLEQIGSAKAGILRTGRPAVIGEDAASISSVRSACERLNVSLSIVKEERTDFHAALPTLSQALARKVVEILQPQLPVSARAERAGIQVATLPGRFQCHRHKDVLWVLDTAHNAQAGEWLSKRLQSLSRHGKTYALWSCFADKDAGALLAPVAKLCDVLVVTQTETERCASLDALTDSAQAVKPDALPISTVKEAVQWLHTQTHPGDVVVVFGGFAIISECLLNLETESVPTQQKEFSYGQ